jgi:hypothetical protein
VPGCWAPAMRAGYCRVHYLEAREAQSECRLSPLEVRAWMEAR